MNINELLRLAEEPLSKEQIDLLEVARLEMEERFMCEEQHRQVTVEWLNRGYDI